MRPVRGLEDTLRELKKFEPRTATQARKVLRNSAKPLVAAGRDAIPGTPPLSRWVVPKSGGVMDIRGRHTVRSAGASRLPVWDSDRARRGIGLSFANRRVRLGELSGRTMVFAFVQRDGAGITFNSAGHKTNNVFSKNLTAKYGKGQRYMWPVAKSKLPMIRREVKRTLEEVERVTNERLRMYF